MSFTLTLPSGLPDGEGGLPSPALSPSVIRLKAQLTPELENSEAHSEFDSAFEKVDPTHEVRGLKSEIIEIKTSFSNIYHAFERHDLEAKRSGTRHCVQPLAPKWAALRKRFNALINESQMNAVDAYAVLEKYAAIFTAETIKSHDYSTIKTEIDNFILVVDEKTKEASSIEGSLSDLADDVRSFDNDVQDTLFAVRAAGETVYQELEATSQDVQALRDRLAQMTKEMRDLGIACIACLSTGALSAGAFLFKLSPEAATAAVASVLGGVPLGIGAAKKWNESRELRKQIREGEHTISEFRRKHGGLRVLEESLKHSRESLVGLAEKIDAISGIWHHIKIDMHQLKTELSVDTAGTMTILFDDKLKNTHRVYRKVVSSLKEYAYETAGLGGEKECPDVFGLGAQGAASEAN